MVGKLRLRALAVFTDRDIKKTEVLLERQHAILNSALTVSRYISTEALFEIISYKKNSLLQS